MKSIQKVMMLLMLCCFIMEIPVAPAWATEPFTGAPNNQDGVQDELKIEQENDCREALQEVMSLLEVQNTRLAGDLRRIQRQMTALRADLDKPGLSQIFGGVGYILGLFGIAAFMAARNRDKERETHRTTSDSDG